MCYNKNSIVDVIFFFFYQEQWKNEDKAQEIISIDILTQWLSAKGNSALWGTLGGEWFGTGIYGCCYKSL